MKRLLNALVPLAIVAAAVAFLFRDEVHFLRSYEGTVVRVFRDDTMNASTGAYSTDPMMEIDTKHGRITVEVPLSTFHDARPGMTVKKRPFSNRVSLGR